MKPTIQTGGDAASAHISFRSIVEAAHDAIVSINAEGRIEFWNAAAERLFGWSAEELAGQKIDRIIPEEYLSAHHRGLERVNSGGAHHVIGKTAELMGRRKDGTTFPLELSLSKWESPAGVFYGGIIRDITERKRAEEELQESARRFESITATANDAIISADGEGLILSWNSSAEKIFGHSATEAIGQPLEIIIPEKYREGHRAGIRRVASGGDMHVIGHTVELQGLHKEGRIFPIELSLSCWSANDQMFFCGIIRDISERKAAEAALKDSADRFASITETASDAIISADQSGVIQLWNSAATGIFGHSATEAIGQPLEIIIPEKYREGHRAGIRRVASGGDRHVIGHTVELQGLHKDGKIFPIELSLSSWTTNGHTNFCGIVRDITERKIQEEALKQSRELLQEKARKLKEANFKIRQKSEQLEGLSQKLAKYLSRQVYDSIFEGQRDVKIESYRKKLTVFFSDIQGFTEFSDRMESEVLTNILNSYLNEMSKIATEYGGTIDKFIGDAIMIFFGDPETEGDKTDAVKCVKMALRMRERLAELHDEWRELGIARPLNVRMGINTGYCTVGNFGSEERMDYTIVGSQVNLASRLESMAEVNQILISEDTYLLIKSEVACMPMEEVKVKGIAYPVQTYQVVDLLENLDSKHEKLMTRLKGFQLKLDADELDEEEKVKIREVLSRAMELLQ